MKKAVSFGMLLLWIASGTLAEDKKGCDRECLKEHVDGYVTALVAHDPSKLALAQQVRFTENAVPLRVGSGLWKTASGVGSYKHYYLDGTSGQAAFVGTLRENGNGVVLALRLKITERKLSEIETIVIRDPATAERYEAQGVPHAIWDEELPPKARRGREELVKITNSYFESILHAKGSLAPFDPQCIRSENGFFSVLNTTTKEVWSKGAPGFDLYKMGCAQQMDTGIWNYIRGIRDRRFPVIDVEHGVVVAFIVFDHPGTVPDVDVPGFGRVPTPALFMKPSSMTILEAFKIVDGRIREIQADGTFLPFGQKTSWEEPRSAP
ncbi:MAG: hypothetical protein JO042_06645 [Sinobacteraceae bacterium]|nr:hypothetical protein [Nevskiaceae bacterium]